MLAYLREGETFAELAAGFGGGYIGAGAPIRTPYQAREIGG